jgi:predicted DNA-binding transcriptional regulator AlpA
VTDQTPAFLPARAVAKRLGWSLSTFTKYLPKLRRAGFPEPHPIIGRYLVADVETWIDRQRKLTDSESKEAGEVNWNGL